LARPFFWLLPYIAAVHMNNILIAFIAGLTTGGLSCLAVQGGLLATSIAAEVEQNVVAKSPNGAQFPRGAQPTSARREKTGASARPPLSAGRPIVLFLGAKLVAYTILGFLLGWIGSVLQLTPITRAILQVGIGVFMVGNALRMLNVHPIFRYFALQPPAAVTRYIRRTSKGDPTTLTPLFLGALTILIPCGVTQAMMAVAIGTGSALAGACIMFAFILGTSPVFFAVAYLATRLGSRLEASFTRIVAVVVLVLGLIAIDAGLTLAGWPYSVTNLRVAMVGRATGPAAQDVGALSGASTERSVNSDPAQSPGSASQPAPRGLADMVGPVTPSAGVVTITVANNGYLPRVARAKAGRPFRLAMVTRDTYSCARALVVPSLGIQQELPATGTVMIDIPAQPAGSKLFYSCSMGMYSGVIVFDG
jgi:sulfite exporter TauE/SafE